MFKIVRGESIQLRGGFYKKKSISVKQVTQNTI